MLKKITSFIFHEDEKRRADIWIFGAMALSATLSLVASLVLSAEAIHLAKNPEAPADMQRERRD